MSKLFAPYDLSGAALANRVVMAPMTRTRTPENIPGELTALYYAQRASAGLIVTEGLPVSEEGRGYLYTPGLYTDEQRRGWRTVTDAVHAKGGKIFAQLWHVGRMSHVSIQPGNIAPVSSGVVPATGTTVYAFTETGEPGPVAPSTPRALTTDDVRRVTQDFVNSARRAIEAGFDGIELMAANAFLFDQFLSSELNNRTDQYGGSIESRQRFLLETVDALAEAIGGAKVGVRLSPFGRLYDLQPFAGEEETWMRVASALNERTLAYVHLNYQPTISAAEVPAGFGAAFRGAYRGTLIAAGGFDRDLAEAELAKGDLDLIAFGASYIANPDLVERMRNGWPLAKSDPSTFYGVIGAKGYTDYPSFDPTDAATDPRADRNAA
ncbi:alkene reductase [Rhizobium nepotum]|uniref:alkene reductase n=1 Tax=Rhizobium nepotum TaxID=1035271 RepID=UPI003369D94F